MTDRCEKYQEEYEIDMTVPLGVRHGTMQFEEDSGNITGIMNILGRTTGFTGLLRDKKMIITGELDIGIRKIAYTGYGILEYGRLHMQIKNQEHIYELNGHKKG